MKYFTLLILLVSNFVFSQTKLNPLIPYRDGKIWGFCDTLGKIVVKPYFDGFVDCQYDLSFPDKAYFLIEKKSKKFVVNEKNQITVPINHVYDSIRLKEYDMDYIEVFKHGKMGLFANLKEVIPCNYTAIEVVENESFRVYLEDKCGIINAKNKLIVPIKYDEIYPFRSDASTTNSKFAWEASLGSESVTFYDTKIIRNNQDAVGIVYEKTAVDYLNDDDGLTLSNLRKVYDNVVYDEYKELAFVTKNNKVGVFSLLEKKLVVDLNYDEVSFADNDKGRSVFKVKLNNKFGFVSENNFVLLPVEYDAIQYNSKIYQFEITKNNKVGLKVFNTIYPTIQPNYIEILDYRRLSINSSWSFLIFLVKTETGIGFVGENGTEYFKN